MCSQEFDFFPTRAEIKLAGNNGLTYVTRRLFLKTIFLFFYKGFEADRTFADRNLSQAIKSHFFQICFTNFKFCPYDGDFQFCYERTPSQILPMNHYYYFCLLVRDHLQTSLLILNEFKRIIWQSSDVFFLYL